MIPIIKLIFFAFGLTIGRFLNVVIYRLNTNRSLGGRSACMSCESKLRFHELIPLISFLILRGRCGTCKTRISVQYPLVELATWLIFVLLFLKFQDLFFINLLSFVVTYAYYGILFSILVVIAAYDFRHKIIPDVLSFSFSALAFLGIFFFQNSNFLGFSFHLPSIWEFFSGVIIASPFALLWFISKGAWMGLGDAKLSLGIGWLLGLTGGFYAVVLAFWIGAISGIILMMTSSRYKMKTEIPFAPYLILGTLLVFLFNFSFLQIIF